MGSQFGINNQTKECALVVGDECCGLPNGWIDLGLQNQTCPSGYKTVEIECVPYKSHFCCSHAHSGMNGNCEDVVVNLGQKKCAFVEDISLCQKLPSGWSRAEKISKDDFACPYSYNDLNSPWLKEYVECEKVPVINNNSQTKFLFIISIISGIVLVTLIYLFYRILKH